MQHRALFNASCKLAFNWDTEMHERLGTTREHDVREMFL